MTNLSKLHYKNTNPVSLSTPDFSFKHARISRDVFILFRRLAVRSPQTEKSAPRKLARQAQPVYRSCITGASLWYELSCLASSEPELREEPWMSSNEVVVHASLAATSSICWRAGAICASTGCTLTSQTFLVLYRIHWPTDCDTLNALLLFVLRHSGDTSSAYHLCFFRFPSKRFRFYKFRT